MAEAYEYTKEVKCLSCAHCELCGSGMGGVNMCMAAVDCPHYIEMSVSKPAVQEDSLEDLFKESLRAELACIECGIDASLKVEVREDILDGAFKMALGELSKAICTGALAEYFLVIGDYDLAKKYHKQYTKELKELL